VPLRWRGLRKRLDREKILKILRVVGRASAENVIYLSKVLLAMFVIVAVYFVVGDLYRAWLR
jgi:hypothetical protein